MHRIGAEFILHHGLSPYRHHLRRREKTRTSLDEGFLDFCGSVMCKRFSWDPGLAAHEIAAVLARDMAVQELDQGALTQERSDGLDGLVQRLVEDVAVVYQEAERPSDGTNVAETPPSSEADQDQRVRLTLEQTLKEVCREAGVEPSLVPGQAPPATRPVDDVQQAQGEMGFSPACRAGVAQADPGYLHPHEEMAGAEERPVANALRALLQGHSVRHPQPSGFRGVLSDGHGHGDGRPGHGGPGSLAAATAPRDCRGRRGDLGQFYHDPADAVGEAPANPRVPGRRNAPGSARHLLSGASVEAAAGARRAIPGSGGGVPGMGSLGSLQRARRQERRIIRRSGHSLRPGRRHADVREQDPGAPAQQRARQPAGARTSLVPGTNSGMRPVSRRSRRPGCSCPGRMARCRSP